MATVLWSPRSQGTGAKALLLIEVRITLKNTAGIIGFVLSGLTCQESAGATWCVDGSVSVAGDGRSWETAFYNIQEGIDAASNGDTVIVREGTYVENIQFNGKNIVLTSTDPSDRSVVENTIIDGSKSGSVVRFLGTEDKSCVLAGFTIRNGDVGYPGHGGGIAGGGWLPEVHTRATILNNVISDNTAHRGGGLASCDGYIANNTIVRNRAGRGGGLRWCNGAIENNIITLNSAGGEGGGGLDHCAGVIRNNVISGNSSEDGDGGVDGCDGIIQNNLIMGNSTTEEGCGGGLGSCHGAIINNTVVGNASAAGGGGLCGCRGIIVNCVIWGNTGAPGEAQLGGSSHPIHCCIQDWTGGGTGNSKGDPRFVGPGKGDYHLQLGSECIEGGINYYWLAWPQRDLDGNCRLFGMRVDIGCYEYGASADSDGDLLSDGEEAQTGTDAARPDTDGDGLLDGLELLRGTDPLNPGAPGVINVPSDMPTIQQALCLALSGEEIVVGPGTHDENIHFCGKDVILRSLNPRSAEVVASTIIDGGGRGPVVSFAGNESEACVLSGFTITGGTGGYGGGISGHSTRATILNSKVSSNSATWGGGLAYCNGTICNNTISGNSAFRGGGLANCDGIIEGNVVARNVATYIDGGGLSECNGTIRNNTISQNSADREGGGLSWCLATIVNCIIWGNTPPQSAQLSQCRLPTYSCIERWTGGGEGNISQNPQFIRLGFLHNAGTPEDQTDDFWVEGDYRLCSDSPCIDSGDDSAADPASTDIAGTHRITFGGKSLTVDVGAFEYYVNEIAGDVNGGVSLTWSSLSGKTYAVYRSDDMLTWEVAADSIASAGDTVTTWIDPMAPLILPDVPRGYYRVQEKE